MIKCHYQLCKAIWIAQEAAALAFIDVCYISREWQENNTYKPILLPSLSKMCHALSSALLSWQMKTQTFEVMVCLEWQAMGTESDRCVKIPRYACYLRSLGPIYNMIVQQTSRRWIRTFTGCKWGELCAKMQQSKVWPHIKTDQHTWHTNCFSQTVSALVHYCIKYLCRHGRGRLGWLVIRLKRRGFFHTANRDYLQAMLRNNEDNVSVVSDF